MVLPRLAPLEELALPLSDLHFAPPLVPVSPPAPAALPPSLGVQSACICLGILALFSVLRFFNQEVKAAAGITTYLVLEGGFFAAFVLYIWRTSRLQRESAPHVTRRAKPIVGPGHAADPLLTLRFFACFMVLAGHGLLINFRPDHLLSDAQTHAGYTFLMPEPWIGVWVFFVLSGYLMGKGFFSGRYTSEWTSSLCFYRNRFLRIVPLYLLSTFLVALFCKPELFQPHQLWKLLALTLFFDPTTDSRPNDALWSVGAEMEFYLTIPFIFVLLGACFTRRPLVSFGLIVIIGFLFRALQMHSFTHKLDLFAGPALGFLDLFLAGFVLNAIIRRYREHLTLRHGLNYAFALVAGYYLIAAWFCRSGRVLHISTEYRSLLLIFPTASILLVSLIIFLIETAPRANAHPALRWIIRQTQTAGLLTYSLYTWHEPLYKAFSNLLHDHQFRFTLPTSLGMIMLGTFFVWLLAQPSYHHVELYFERKKKLL